MEAGTGGSTDDTTGAVTDGGTSLQSTTDAGDSGSTGAGESGGSAFDPETFVLEDVYGVPNLDDDDEDGVVR